MEFDIIKADNRMEILTKRSDIISDLSAKIGKAMGLRKDGKFQTTAYTAGDIFEWSKDVAWVRFFDDCQEKLKSLAEISEETRKEMEELQGKINLYVVTEKLKGNP